MNSSIGTAGPSVGAYVKVPRDCDISYRFEVGGDVAVLLGSARDGFEIIFERAALRHLVEVAGQALRTPPSPDRDHGAWLGTGAVV